MDSTIIEKLRLETKEINDIMLRAQSSFKIVDYLLRDHTLEEAEIIRNNQFLKYSRTIHWKDYVIEMVKLFADRRSEHYNLHDFIKKFKPGNEFSSITPIDEHSILIWEKNLELEKGNIKSLQDQRDKQYSHTDRDGKHIENKLSFKDAKELLQVVQRIVSEIYVAVFGSHISFDPIGEPIDDLKRLVASAVNQRREQLKYYAELAREHNIDPKEIGLPENID